MASGTDAGLTQAEAERLRAIRSAEDLDALVALYGVDSKHDAYFEAKREWAELRAKTVDLSTTNGIPGSSVTVGDRRFHVHGVTHADTEAERSFLREHVSEYLEAGHDVYCEQGIRRMYFQDIDAVCAMDDIRWAMAECKRMDIDSILSELPESEFEGLKEDVRGLAARFRESTFSLIESGREVYGDGFANALGDVASEFLMSHGELATGEGFEAFRRTAAAAEDPSKLAALQAYYLRTFLPQPLEREWLWNHDPELEVMTHARNERMADYLVHDADAGDVHCVVGAAHQPGVPYYLERHRDGKRSIAEFEPM